MKSLFLVVATRNSHKVAEIRSILGDACRLDSLAEYPGAPAVIEDAETFAGNARKKSESLARWLAGQTNLPTLPDYVLADDSGLEVDALGGAPGVHSARFAASGPKNAPDADNNAKLVRLLASVPPERRTARFRCVLALTPSRGGSPTEFFDGQCAGRIELEAKGAGGFGYDPLFVPEGFQESFALLGDSVKNTISHRARALGKLREFLAR